jgi:hypothetical protein
MVRRQAVVPPARTYRPHHHASGLGVSPSAEVAAKVGKQPTNTPRMPEALAGRGLVVASDETPTVWRAVSSDR